MCYRKQPLSVVKFCLWIYVGLTVIGLCSCSSSVAIRYFCLPDFLSTEVTGQSAKADLPNIAIENFRSSQMLRRQEIVLHSANSQQILLPANSLWLALPEELVKEAFFDYLVASKLFRQVLSYPTPYPVRYRIEGMVKQFEIVVDAARWQSKVALQVQLVEQEKNEIIWDTGVIRKSVVSNPNLEDAVEKIGQGLQEIFAQVTVGLQKICSR